MIAFRRVGRSGATLPRLLDSVLTGQHCRFLIGLQVNILLHAITVLHALLDEVPRVTVSNFMLRVANASFCKKYLKQSFEPTLKISSLQAIPSTYVFDAFVFKYAKHMFGSGVVPKMHAQSFSKIPVCLCTEN